MAGQGEVRKLRKVVGGLIFFSLLIYISSASWALEATPYRPGKPNLASKPGRVFTPSTIPPEPSAQEEAVSPSIEPDLETLKPSVSPSAPPFASYLTALTNAANRLQTLQEGDGGWAWDVTGAVGPSGTSALNMYGINGLALLDAQAAGGTYLADAVDTGNHLLGVPPADLYFPDMVFLFELFQLTGNTAYRDAGEAGILNFHTDPLTDTAQEVIDDYYLNRSPYGIMSYDFAWTILAYTTYAYVNVDYIKRATELLELATWGQNPGVYKTQFQGAFLSGKNFVMLGVNFYWTGGQGIMLYALQKLYPLLPSANRTKCKTALKAGLERLVMSLYGSPSAAQGAFTSGWYSINGAPLIRETLDTGFGYEAQAQAYALWALGYGMAPTSDYFYQAATFAVNTQNPAGNPLAPAGGWDRAPGGYASWLPHPEEFTEPDAAMVRGLYMAWYPTKVVSTEDLEPIFVGNPFGGTTYVVDFSTDPAFATYIYTSGLFTSAKSYQIYSFYWNMVLNAAKTGAVIYWRFRKKVGTVITPSDTYEFYLLEVPQAAPTLVQLPAGSPPPYSQPAAPPPTFSWLMNGNKTFVLQFTNSALGALAHTAMKSTPIVTYNYKYTLSTFFWTGIITLENTSSPIYWWIKATDRLGRVTYSETRTFSIP